MPDAEGRADEDEGAAARPASEPGSDQLDRIMLGERLRRPEPAPQPHRTLDAQRLVHLDRAPVAAAVRIPKRIDEMDDAAGRGRDCGCSMRRKGRTHAS